jgi:hypothetical protein
VARPITPNHEPRALLERLAADRPVIMINLLRFQQPGGAEQHRRYAHELVPELAS